MARNNAIKIHNTLEYTIKRKSISRGLVEVYKAICDEAIDAINEYIALCKKNGKSIPKKNELLTDVTHRIRLRPPVKEFIEWCLEKGYYDILPYETDTDEIEEDF